MSNRLEALILFSTLTSVLRPGSAERESCSRFAICCWTVLSVASDVADRSQSGHVCAVRQLQGSRGGLELERVGGINSIESGLVIGQEWDDGLLISGTDGLRSRAPLTALTQRVVFP